MLYAMDHDRIAVLALFDPRTILSSDALRPDRYPVFIETEAMHIWRMQAMAGIYYVRPGCPWKSSEDNGPTQTSEHYCPPISCAVLLYKRLIMKNDTHNILFFL
jgi:hypothetical protein